MADFEDSSAGATEVHTPTITGATIDTITYKYGGGAGKFDANEYVHYPKSVDFDFGLNDVTISVWIYKPEGAGFEFNFAYQTNSVSYPVWHVSITESLIYLRAVSAAPIVTQVYIRKIVNIAATGWHHIEIGRDQNVSGYIFIDGVKQTPLDSNTYNGTIPSQTASGSGLEIGYSFNLGGWSDCYADVLAIDKGICRQNADFTPPTDEDVDNDGYRVLLLKMNSGITYNLSAADVISLSDTVIKNITLVKAESFSLSDLLQKLFNVGTIFSDTLILVDNIKKSFGKFEFDNINFQDNLNRVHSIKTILDFISIVDDIAKSLPKSFSDSMLLSDSRIHLLAKNLSDRLEIIDAISFCTEFVQGIIKYITASDSVILSDSFIKSFSKRLTDNMSIVDFIVEVCVHSPIIRRIIFGDNVAISDSLIKSLRKTHTENLSIVDKIKNFIFHKRPTDILSIIDDITKLISHGISDSLVLSDSLIRGYIRGILLSDSLMISDSLVRSTLKSLANTIPLVDGINREVYKVLGTPLSISDELSKRFSSLINDSIPISDYKYWKLFHDPSDSVVLTDSLIKSIYPHKNDNITLFDRICYQISRIGWGIGTETLLLLDNLRKRIGLYKFEQIDLYETFSRLFNKRPNDDIALSDSLIKNVGKLNADQIVMVDNLTKLLSMRGLSENVSIIDILGRLFSYGVSDSMPISDSLIATWIKNLSDIIIPQDTIVQKVVKKVVNTPVALVDALRKQVNKLLHSDEEITDATDIDLFKGPPVPKARKEPVVKLPEDEEWHDITSIQRRGPK